MLEGRFECPAPYYRCLTKHGTPSGIRGQGNCPWELSLSRPQRTGSIPEGLLREIPGCFSTFPHPSQVNPEETKKVCTTCWGGRSDCPTPMYIFDCCLTTQSTPSGSRPERKALPAGPWTCRFNPYGRMTGKSNLTSRTFTLQNRPSQPTQPQPTLPPT